MDKKYCDRCLKEITSGSRGLFRVKIHYATGELIPTSFTDSFTWDLCPKCLKELEEFLGGKDVTNK